MLDRKVYSNIYRTDPVDLLKSSTKNKRAIEKVSAKSAQPGEKKDDNVPAQYSSLGPAYESLDSHCNNPQRYDEPPAYAVPMDDIGKVSDESDHVYAVLERP